MRAEWKQDVYYPMVPGHEMAGVVRQVGSAVTRFQVGDHAGVGTYVMSCRKCSECVSGNENYCSNVHWSYNCKVGDELMYGGYSQAITVHEDYTCKIPMSLPLSAAAPLLCAGVTTYSPLAHFGAKQAGQGYAVAILGFGGLGHIAAKFSQAFGNDVTIISRSPSKSTQASALGAQFLCSSDTGAMAQAKRSFDMIVSTVPGDCDWAPYISLLKLDGRLVVVGLPPNPLQIGAHDLVGSRVSVCGSLVGSIKETEDMLQMCADHGIVCDVEVIAAAKANWALQNLAESSNATARYVIDVHNTLVEGDWQVDADARIKHTDWSIRGTVHPESANLHK